MSLTRWLTRAACTLQQSGNQQEGLPLKDANNKFRVADTLVQNRRILCPLTTGAIRVGTSKGGPLTFQVPVTVLELNELSEL